MQLAEIKKHMDGVKIQIEEAIQEHAEYQNYLTPDEEEKWLHIFVAYWQARNALLETIIENRPQMTVSIEAIDAKRFFELYAAMLILVDMARFILETIDGIDPVRDKLNEGNSYFGIPTKAYNHIQQSMTQTEHLARITWANWMFERLSKINKVPTEIKAITDELKGRAELKNGKQVTDYLKIKGRELKDDWLKPDIEKGIYETQSIISKWVSGISTRSDHHPELPEEIQKELAQELKPGDVLITRKEYAMTNYFLPGYWPHAALYLGKIDQLKNWIIPQNPVDWTQVEKLDSNPHRVIEALKDGVRVRSIASPFGSDCLVILRPKLSDLEIEIALKKSLVHNGKPYDFDFNFNRSDRLVCTEVVYRAYEGLLPERIKLSSRAGRMNVSAEDYLQMALKNKNFELIAGFNPTFEASILKAEALEKMLKKTLI